MSNSMILATVAPQAIERCRRFEFAIMLLRNGIDCCESQRLLRERFKVSRVTAWRIVSAARDMA